MKRIATAALLLCMCKIDIPHVPQDVESIVQYDDDLGRYAVTVTCWPEEQWIAVRMENNMVKIHCQGEVPLPAYER